MSAIIDLLVERKIYKKRRSKVELLQDFSLHVDEGEKVAVVGKSGAGKSTLLNILGLIDRRYTGSYQLLGKNVAHLSDQEMAVLRNEKIGFVLQESALINSLSIADNIRLPLLYTKADHYSYAGKFDEVVGALGLGQILKKKPLECSGGEKARAVFARAIITRPRIILADEPTASLDVENRSIIINLLFGLNRDLGSTIITVTHDLFVAEQHEKIIQLERKE